MKKIISIPLIVLIALGINACGDSNTAANNEGKTTATVSPPNATKGKEIYNQVCSSCHGLSAADGKNNAPVLADLKTKWPDAIALNNFVKNAPDAMQKSEYTKALYEQWKTNIQMPPYIGMSEQEVADVVAYLYEL
jgi:mono/diheme cytochrome c family protein